MKAAPITPICSSQDDGASLTTNSLQHNSSVSPSSIIPNSELDDPPAFSGELHSIFANEESSKHAARSEWNAVLSSGSASTLEEAPNSKHGQERRRKLSGTRGSGERGINKSAQCVYKGVRKRKEDKWVSEIREPGMKTRIWLGTFSTPEMAATAYDVAAFNLKRPYAYLNFPEYASSLPILTSRSPKDIQEAAAAAAASRGITRSSSHMGRTGGLVRVPTPHVDKSSTSLSTEQQKQSTTTETSSIDEDMIFDMPNVLADMAEGLMISPPLDYLAMATSEDNNSSCEHNAESSLWNL